MKLCFYGFCVSVILYSCSEKEKNSLNDERFPINNKLLASDFSLPDDSIGNPMAMLVVDTLLILDDQSKGYLYKVINLKTERIIAHLGSVGKGPGEFLQPTLFELIPGRKPVLGIYDRRTWAYSEMHLDSALENRSYLPKVRFGKFHTNYSSVSKLKDNVFVGTGIFNNRYAIANDSGRIVSYAMEYPYKGEFKRATAADIAFAFQGQIKVKPDGKKFVLTIFNSPNAEIVSFNNGKLSKLVDLYYGAPSFVPESGNGVISVNFKAENAWGFIDVSVSDKFIYLLYSGRTRKEYRSSFWASNTVLVYDWDGNPIAKYALDRDVKAIAVDEADGRIYAATFDPSIVFYTLK